MGKELNPLIDPFVYAEGGDQYPLYTGGGD